MNKKFGVIGIGNPFQGDDGIGPFIIQKIDMKQWNHVFDIVDGGTGGMNLYHIFSSYAVVLLVDAVDFKQSPGKCCFFSSTDISASQRKDEEISTHSFDLDQIIDMIKQTQTDPPKIYVFGVQPKTVSMSNSFSNEVQKKIPRLLAQLEQRIQWIIENDLKE